MHSRQDLIDIVNANKNDFDFLENLLVERAKHDDDFGVSIILPHVNAQSNVFPVLTNTKSTAVVDIMLNSINNTITRSLNKVLTYITDLNILIYILNHPKARFNPGYRQFECVRIATLNGNLDRVRVFIDNAVVNIHSSGKSTLDKTCVELAVIFNYHNIIELFIDNGLKVISAQYTDQINRELIKITINYQKRISNALYKLNDMYFKNNGKVPYEYINASRVMMEIFPNEKSELKLMGKISSLLTIMDNMTSLTS